MKSFIVAIPIKELTPDKQKILRLQNNIRNIRRKCKVNNLPICEVSDYSTSSSDEEDSTILESDTTVGVEVNIY